MRSFRYFDRAATTWRTFCLLSLILFTFDFPRDRFVQAEPIRVSAELVTRDDGHDYGEARGRAESSDDGNSSELVGKWRNNGEALEPKWRDGDTVPLLPFSHFSRYTRDEVDGKEDGDNYGNQGTKYRQNNGRRSYSRTKNGRRVSQPDYEDYDIIERRHEYKTEEEEATFSRRRNDRPSVNEGATTFYEATSKEDEEERNRDDSLANKEVTSSRYREAFQARPNDYEHELNDEEYLRPRPRKRRPPQNYEFALAANEATLRDLKAEDSSRPWSHGGVENLPETEPKNDPQISQNTVELKSLLKMQQEEGTSLSEILQRRNLTLNDLLRGKADVISALKSKDVEDTEDYSEETSRIMLNSFMKISTTERPRWPSTVAPAKSKNFNHDVKVVTRNGSRDENKSSSVETTTSVYRSNNTDAAGTSTSVVNHIKMYSAAEKAVTVKSILVTPDPVRSTALRSTPSSVSTVITTSTPLLVAGNSMELFQSDEGVPKLQNNREIKSESLDEDEIMEFSDFTDYKKGRNGMSPVWLLAKDDEITKSSIESFDDDRRDTGSTLSIEQILGPTERTKPIKNSSTSIESDEQLDDDLANRKIDQAFVKNDQPLIIERPTEDYGTFLEHEYQDDSPLIYDGEQTTQILNDKNDMVSSIMREIESTLNAMSSDGAHPEKNHPSSSNNGAEERNHNYSFRNHRVPSANDRRSYEDIISEIESEARAEIFELFASGSAGKRLERLLKSRNMSIEELIALRQRGSSKVHLAEVTRLKVRKPNVESRVENNENSETTSTRQYDEYRSTTANENAYGFEEQTVNKVSNYPLESPCNNKTNSDDSGAMNFVRLRENTTQGLFGGSVSSIQSEESTVKSNEKTEINQHGHRDVEIVDLLTTFASLPFAKDTQREFRADYGEATKRKSSIETSEPSVVFMKDQVDATRINNSKNAVRSGYVEEIVKEEPNSIDIRTLYSEADDKVDADKENNEDRKTLSKVQPSIIASGAILGVTIVVFLAIFIACRVRQKQKYRYRNTFSRAVFQGPVLAARKLSNSSSLSTVMVNVIATSTTKRPDRSETQESTGEMDFRSDIDNDSLDANDSWETIPDYMK